MIKDIISCLERGLYRRMKGKALLEYEATNNVTKIEKEDCLTVDQAAEKLNVSRASLYGYMNVIDVQRYRFRRDRHTYISKRDLARIEDYIGKSPAEE